MYITQNIDSCRSSFLDNTNSNVEVFEWSTVSIQDILNATKSMSASESLDFYGMSNNLLKCTIVCLAEPLVFCINNLLKDGIFPDELKISRICPVYKKGPKDQPQSYRPISIIPVLGKLIEVLVYNQLFSFFDRNNIFNSSQFGFRRGKSTTNALDELVRQIYLSFEKKSYAQATFCDLSKAFDCVDRSILLGKLEHYGIHACPLKFFKSYLENRSQMVLVNGEWSEKVLVEWGVPQGSVLGPLLFLIYINDLPTSVTSKTILYADDTTFWNSSSDMNELVDMVDETMTNASNWFQSNGFLLNQDKTQNMLFSLRHNTGSTNQKFVEKVKFLGVFIDNHLTWSSHIDYLSTRLSRVIYLLSKLRNSVPQNYIRSAYFSYFQSVFRYGLILFGNCSRIQEILILQKKVLRILNGSGFKDHCKPIFIDLQIQTVINLYIFDLIKYIYENKNLLKISSSDHSYNTRNRFNAKIDFCRLSKTLNSHTVMSLKVYNVLEVKINLYPSKEFQDKFYSWLLKNPFYSLTEFFNASFDF